MDDQVRMQAEAAARLLLRRYREEQPAWNDDKTPVDALASWLGFHVETFHPSNYAQGTYGFIDADLDEHLIWLCRDLKESFRRFTLAHELGHVMLHCRTGKRVEVLLQELETLVPTISPQVNMPELSPEDPCHGNDVREETAGLADQEYMEDVLGSSHSYDPRSRREVAANIFAAELLMPLERIRALYLQQRIPAAKLVETFAVSHAALLHRLVGLLKDVPTPLSLNTPSSTPTPADGEKRYDEFQRAAIEAPTPTLITAGPGSGKTSTLIGRITYMVETLAIAPQHILALTFSRKAAQEMEERLQSALQRERYALPTVSTFHAFCADMLREYGELVGLRQNFALVDDAEGYFLLRRVSNELRLRHYQNLHNPATHFPAFLSAISRAKDELVTPEAYEQLAQRMYTNAVRAADEEALQQAEKALEVAHVYALYEQELQRRGDTDFGGLLVLAIRLLREQPAVVQAQQQHYQHILVDEFQDMNRASGVLLRELAGEARRVWVVGDANQAIYGFRGASPANIGNFEADFPGAVVLPLSRNYRSRPDLVQLAESFRCVQLELGQEPGKNQPVRLTQPDTSVTLAKAVNEASEMVGLVQDIQRKHAQGFAYKDMVVLCRTRSHVQKVSQALLAAGVPILERSGMLEQEHIKNILAVLHLITNPSGMGILRAARLGEHPLSERDVEAILLAASETQTSPGLLLVRDEPPATLSIEGHRSFQRLSEILRNLQHPQYSPHIWSLLAHYLCIETSFVRDLLLDATNAPHVGMREDVEALLQLAQHYDQQQHLRLQQEDAVNEVHVVDMMQEQTPPKIPLQEQIRGFLEYISLLIVLRQDGGNRQASEGENEETNDVIRVMTVHASKGLEFPVVYLPGVTQQRFPLQYRSSSVPVPDAMLPAESTGKQAHESGESCLFYVGVTRARDQLVVSYSERYGKRKYKRSLYLDALEQGLSEDRLNTLLWNAVPVQEDTSALVTGGEQQDHTLYQPSVSFLAAMKPKTLHVSALESYLRCPRHYVYSMVYHFENEEGAYQRFWQATQKAAEEVRKRVQETKGQKGVKERDGREGRPLTREQLQALYTEQWRAVGGHEAPFASMYEQHGYEVVALLERELVTNEAEWSVRPTYTVEVADTTVHVTVDRVEMATQAGVPVKFVRTRFGKRKEPPTADTREMLYARAYRQMHPGQELELHAHNLSTGETVPIKLTAKKEQSLLEEVKQAVEGIEHDRYPVLPAEPYHCPTCPFFLLCPV